MVEEANAAGAEALLEELDGAVLRVAVHDDHFLREVEPLPHRLEVTGQERDRVASRYQNADG
jgi:hypothetical protein